MSFSLDYPVSELTQKIWRIELDLADVLLDMCNKYNLKIWAAYGTLIGAARHKGFIPWDNDLDFVMMRSDYDKLLNLIRSNELFLPKNFEFDLADIAVIKLRRTDTTMYSKSYRLCNKLSHGIWIDVFCLDVAPDDVILESEKYKSLKTKIRIHHNAHLGYYANEHTIPRTIGHFVFKLYYLFKGYDSQRELIENMLRDDRNRYSGNKIWGFLIWSTIKKDICKIAIHDISSYNETIMMPFEDRVFPCPKEYDKILTAQYGDWRTPVIGGSQHEGVHVDVNKPYKKYIEETLRNMPWWKRYWYKH
jgi:lipopolysaccharide cholinephosphotransferase